MNREEYRCGLWKREAKSGVKYCSGKLKIGDREWSVTLFNNDKKRNEKAPDFNLIVKDSINSQGTKKDTQNNIEIEPSKGLDEKVFEEFGNDTTFEISEDEFPF